MVGPVERISFFDPAHGIGLCIAAGSGRSWIDEPDGDPRHAHCWIDVPRDTLVVSSETDPRPRSQTLFVAWDVLLRFADEIADLGAAGGPGIVRLGDRYAMVGIRMRRDGRLRAECAFTVGQHVTMTLRCRTLWNRHFGLSDDLPVLADRVRSAVRAVRP